MAMGNASNAVVAKVRAIYGNRLTPDDFNMIVHKNSVSGIVNYLKTTDRFKKTLSNVNESQIHRGQLEVMISKSVFETYTRLVHFSNSGRNGFEYYFIKRAEVQQILNAAMFINAKAFDSFVTAMPTYISAYLCFDLMSLAKAKTYDDMINVLTGTPYRSILLRCVTGEKDRSGGEIQIEKLETELYTYLVSQGINSIDKEFGGKEKNEMKEALLRQLDLDNVLTCFRMSAVFGRDSEEVRKMLIPLHYRLSEKRLCEIFSDTKAAENVIDFLKSFYVRQNVEINSGNIDYFIRKTTYDYFRSKMRQTTYGSVAMYSLILLMEIENSNLITAIEGVRYAIDGDEIKKMLVM